MSLAPEDVMPPWTLPSPSEAACSMLDGVVLLDGDVQLLLGDNLFRSPMRVADDVPEQAVFVYTSGGAFGVTHDAKTQCRATVMVEVRGRRHAYAETEALARAVLRQLHLNVPALYQDMQANTCEPEFVGMDAGELPRFSIQCTVTRIE